MQTFYYLFFSLIVFAETKETQSNATVNIVDALIKEKNHLKEILLEEHKNVSKIISELYPELKEQIASIQEDIHYCYDKAVTENEKVDIFKTKMKTVVKSFFVSNKS